MGKTKRKSEVVVVAVELTEAVMSWIDLAPTEDRSTSGLGSLFSSRYHELMDSHRALILFLFPAIMAMGWPWSPLDHVEQRDGTGDLCLKYNRRQPCLVSLSSLPPPPPSLSLPWIALNSAPSNVHNSSIWRGCISNHSHGSKPELSRKFF